MALGRLASSDGCFTDDCCCCRVCSVVDRDGDGITVNVGGGGGIELQQVVELVALSIGGGEGNVEVDCSGHSFTTELVPLNSPSSLEIVVEDASVSVVAVDDASSPSVTLDMDPPCFHDERGTAKLF